MKRVKKMRQNPISGELLSWKLGRDAARPTQPNRPIMANSSSQLLPFIRRIMIDQRLKNATDHELVTRFVELKEESAFEAILRRHGPMVLNVCRSVLTNEADIEDAFQAAFLVLARQMSSLRRSDALASWLHGISYRIALKARTTITRRLEREAQQCPRQVTDTDQLTWSEIREILHVELALLPERHRIALTFCYLQGNTQEEAARLLGLSRGTLKRRLERGRALLRERLSRRGLGSAMILLTAAWPVAQATARIPPLLVKSTVQAAVDIATGSTPALSSVAVTLTKGVLNMMATKTIKGVAFMACGLLALAWLAAGDIPLQSPAPVAAAVLDDQKVAPKVAPKAADPKPLPQGPNLLLIEWFGHLSLIDPTGKNEQKLPTTALGRFTDSVRLSPDGKRVAFVANDGETAGVLHVAGVDDKEGRSLEVSTGPYAWSPDSTEIACTEFPEKDKKLTAVHWLINVKTKEKTQLKLPDDHYIVDWSRDGKHFLTTRTWPNAGIFLMNRDGTEHKSLTAKQLPAGSFGQAGRLSPDGKRLLFTIVTPPKEKEKPVRKELAVLDTVSGKVAPVTDIPINGEFGSYCWSPDGKRIAYIWTEVLDGNPEDVADKDIESQLVVCDPDGKNAKSIATEKGRLATRLLGTDWR